MAMTALVGFFHFIRVGPNETDAGDEEAANEMARTERAPEKVP
jgi:formate dehydrogenase iron-sulfur subunit